MIRVPLRLGGGSRPIDALDDHVATLTISKKPLGEGTLTFRSRYETPFRSVASAEKNDGLHFPHWRMNLMPQVEGTGLVFTDNHVWNTLQLSDGDQPRDQQEGLRPQKRWIAWSLLRLVSQLNLSIAKRVPPGLLSLESSMPRWMSAIMVPSRGAVLKI